MATLSLQLLGGFQTRGASGAELALPGRKAAALLAVLALAGDRPVSRDRLIGLLWSDRGETQARASLRQALSEARQALGEAAPVLVADRDAVVLDPSGVEIDVVTFQRLAAEVTAEALSGAAALYRGELLSGLDGRDAVFDGWLRGERSRFHDTAIGVLEHLMALQFGEARIASGRRLLELDPAHEGCHRALMEALAAAGNRTGALRQYQLCRDALRDLLDTEPEVTTTVLHERLLAGDLVPPARSAPSPVATTAPVQVAGEPRDTRPTVAILPFHNMSGDAEQEYFSDGITEDIITELARFHSLSVVARNSTFHFKGRSPKVQEVALELDASYVVEGSVRKAGQRVRITAQLIEASSGIHVWAERYDRVLEDIFDVQDEIVRAVVGAVSGQLERRGHDAARGKRPENLTAYDLVLRGRWITWHSESDQGLAIQFFEQAVAIDPNCAPAHIGLAQTSGYGIYALGLTWQEAASKARHHTERALAIDSNDPLTQAMAGMACILTGEHDLAAVHSERAFALNPNDPMILAMRGGVLAYLGQPEHGREFCLLSARLQPFDPDDTRLEILFDSQYMAGDDAGAAETARKMRAPHPHMRIEHAAALAQLGRLDEARTAVAASTVHGFSHFDPVTFVHNHVRMCAQHAQTERWLDGYRKAGLAV